MSRKHLFVGQLDDKKVEFEHGYLAMHHGNVVLVMVTDDGKVLGEVDLESWLKESVIIHIESK